MRILLADDNPRVRSALRTLLQQQRDVEVAGEAWDVEGLVAAIQELSPDLVLLDWELPGLASAVALACIRLHYPELQVIVLSGRFEARQVALDLGADAFVSKSAPPQKLLESIRSAAPAK